MVENDKYLNDGRTVMNKKYIGLCISIDIVKHCDNNKMAETVLQMKYFSLLKLIQFPKEVRKEIKYLT